METFFSSGVASSQEKESKIEDLERVNKYESEFINTNSKCIN